MSRHLDVMWCHVMRMGEWCHATRMMYEDMTKYYRSGREMHLTGQKSNFRWKTNCATVLVCISIAARHSHITGQNLFLTGQKSSFRCKAWYPVWPVINLLGLVPTCMKLIRHKAINWWISYDLKICEACLTLHVYMRAKDHWTIEKRHASFYTMQHSLVMPMK